MNCPSCHQEMSQEKLDAKYGKSFELDICHFCSAFWFDDLEDLALTPDGVLPLFVVINDNRPTQRSPLATAMACPRCRQRLVLMHDMQRTTRFTYLGLPRRARPLHHVLRVPAREELHSATERARDRHAQAERTHRHLLELRRARAPPGPGPPRAAAAAPGRRGAAPRGGHRGLPPGPPAAPASPAAGPRAVTQPSADSPGRRAHPRRRAPRPATAVPNVSANGG